MRTVVLVDGEHYPPVTRWAIATATERGHDVVGALFVGGIEKIEPGSLPDLGVPTRSGGDRPRWRRCADAIDDLASRAGARSVRRAGAGLPRAHGARRRWRCTMGVPYAGPTSGSTRRPRRRAPPRPDPRRDRDRQAHRQDRDQRRGGAARGARPGLDPVVVAMGRGGPPEPQVAEAGAIDLERLVELVRAGRARARRTTSRTRSPPGSPRSARGGPGAGSPESRSSPTCREAAALAADARPRVADPRGQRLRRAADPMGCRGPGRARQRAARIPRAATSAPTGCCAPTSPLLPWRPARTGSENLSALRSHILRYLDDARLLITDFIPVPLADVQGRAGVLRHHGARRRGRATGRTPEASHGCTVVGWSARLADRAGLAEDLDAAQGYDVLLTELKAAAVDIGVERALARGAEVVFVDNRARRRGGIERPRHGPAGDDRGPRRGARREPNGERPNTDESAR